MANLRPIAQIIGPALFANSSPMTGGLNAHGLSTERIVIIFNAQALGVSMTPMQIVTEYITNYQLLPAEVERLNALLLEIGPSEIESELKEELKWIMGDRKLSKVKILSHETIDKARERVESGQTAFVLQDVE